MLYLKNMQKFIKSYLIKSQKIYNANYTNSTSTFFKFTPTRSKLRVRNFTPAKPLCVARMEKKKHFYYNIILFIYFRLYPMVMSVFLTRESLKTKLKLIVSLVNHLFDDSP